MLAKWFEGLSLSMKLYVCGVVIMTFAFWASMGFVAALFFMGVSCLASALFVTLDD